MASTGLFILLSAGRLVFRTHIHPHTRIHGETDLIIRSVVHAPLLCSWMSAHYILLLLLFLSVSNTRQHDQCRSLALNEVFAQHCKHFVFRPNRCEIKLPTKLEDFYQRWFGKQEYREELAAIVLVTQRYDVTSHWREGLFIIHDPGPFPLTASILMFVWYPSTFLKCFLYIFDNDNHIQVEFEQTGTSETYFLNQYKNNTYPKHYLMW